MKEGTKIIMCAAIAMSHSVMAVSAQTPVVLEKIVVDKIWPGVPVRYCLLTYGDTQYIAYYDSDRHMAVAQRKLTDKTFTKTVLPSRQGWDSHNYITMAIDKQGYIHLSGNMHAYSIAGKMYDSPLVYFRSEKPGDISTLKQVKSMVGAQENRATYPEFMEDPKGNLIFKYRHGVSGDGIWFYNIYDAGTKTWKRFLDNPLLGGKGRNAYGSAPRLGPDGMYHMYWMWRKTGDAATNHDISYARSKDMLHWETAGGKALPLPITFADKGTIVDPVPVRGGLLNMGNGMGFDSQNRVLITYCRYDKDGNNQGYAARFDDGKWTPHQITDWNHRWNFGGGGSIACKVMVGSPRIHGDGKLAVPYRHEKYGNGLLILDEETLALLGTEPEPRQFPEALTSVTADFPEMQVRWQGDRGSSADKNSRYVLRWETLGTNRDGPRKGPLPEGQDLVLYKISKNG